MNFMLYTLHQTLVNSNKPKGMRWVMHVGRMGDMRIAYDILTGKPKRKIPFGRPRHRWQYIKIDLKYMKYVDLIHLAQGSV
jgi:hypothetical protein